MEAMTSEQECMGDISSDVEYVPLDEVPVATDKQHAAFLDLPQQVQQRIFRFAWQATQNAQQRQALYRSCSTAREATAAFISSLEVEADMVDGALLAALNKVLSFGVSKNATLRNLTLRGISNTRQEPIKAEAGSTCSTTCGGVGPMLAQVTRLHFQYAGMVYEDLKQLASHLPALQHLEVLAPQEPHICLEPFGVLPLTFLRLDAHAGMQPALLQDISHFTALQHLDITPSQEFTLQQVVESVSNLSHLRSLSVTLPKHFSLDLADTQGLHHLTSLRSLQLQHSTSLLEKGLLGPPWGAESYPWRNADQLCLLTQLTSLLLPSDVLLPSELVRLFRMPHLQHLEVAAFLGDPPAHPTSLIPPDCSLRSLTLALPHVNHYGSANLFLHLTHLTSLVVRGPLAEGAAELALRLPRLQHLVAARLIPDSGKRDGAAPEWREVQQLHADGSSSGGTCPSCLVDVTLGDCRDAAELLLLPSSVTSLQVLSGRVEWQLAGPSAADEDEEGDSNLQAGTMQGQSCEDPVGSDAGSNDGYPSPEFAGTGGDAGESGTEGAVSVDPLRFEEVHSAIEFLAQRWRATEGQSHRDLLLVLEPMVPPIAVSELLQAWLPVLLPLRHVPLALTACGWPVDTQLLRELSVMAPSLRCLRLQGGSMAAGSWAALPDALPDLRYLELLDVEDGESAGIVDFCEQAAGRELELVLGPLAQSEQLVVTLQEVLSLIEGSQMRVSLLEDESAFERYSMHELRVIWKVADE